MSLSKYAATAIAVLMTLLCSISTVNASVLSNDPLLGAVATKIEYSKGGPRDVVQTMTDVIVFQPTEDNLYINIINNEGEIVLQQETQGIKTVLSIMGLENGAYTVETIDDSEDIQEFTIEVL